MKACIVGATGLVGESILKELLNNDQIKEVVIFVRRSGGHFHTKLKEMIVDFDHVEQWSQNISGDILFSALGTTIKTAGSREAQYKVDYDYQFKIAKAAAENGVGTYVLISSVGADANSAFFYMRMKGQLEEAVSSLNFSSINFLRPGPLKGHRKIMRLSEKVLTGILDNIPSFLVGSGQRPVEGTKVASVAITAGLKSDAGINIIEAKKIFENL